MDFKEIKTKSISDLHKLLADTRENLRDLRFKAFAGSLKKVREIRLKKREIARILTIINKQKIIKK